MRNRMRIFCCFARYYSMSVAWLFLLHLCTPCLIFAGHSTAQCTNTDVVRSCSLPARAEKIRIIGDELLVGVPNALLNYDLDALQHKSTVDLSSEVSRHFCRTTLAFNEESCNNFIKVIEPLPQKNSTDTILVCGTNSYQPKCTLHQRNELSIYSNLTDESSDLGLSPYSRDDFIVGLLASSGRFYTAISFSFISQETGIGMAPNVLTGDNTFTVKTTATVNNTLLNTPIQYMSVHEYGDHIYFFVVESALELTQDVQDRAQKVQYARVVRICKADDGIGKNHFKTFQKARIECKTSANADNTYKYVYNNLRSTFMGSENGMPVLYATFNSPSNGPIGGAVCKFSFSSDQPGSLTEVFGNAEYNVRTVVENSYVWTKVTMDPPLSCQGATNRTAADIEKFSFVHDSVTSIPNADRPLFTMDEFLDKIAAETVTYNGDAQEIIYYSNHLGQLKQVVQNSTGNSYPHVILDSITNEDGSTQEIRDLLFRMGEDGTRSLYISRGSDIVQVYRGSCDKYASCHTCLDSRDAYCGWDRGSGLCVKKSGSNIASLIQSFSASEESIAETCGSVTTSTERPFPSLPPCPVGTTSSGSSSSTVASSQVNCVNVTDPGGLSKLCTNQAASIATIVGATLGALVLGAFVGGAITLLFCHFSKRGYHQVHDKCKSPRTNASTSTDLEVGLESISNGVLNNEITKNHSNTTTKQTLSEVEKITPPPRYVEHAPPPISLPPIKEQVPSTFPVAPPISTTNNYVPSEMATGSSNTLPNKRRSNRSLNKFNFPSPTKEDEDSAFVEGDTLPPLKNFNGTSGPMYGGSLGRNKSRSVGYNGVRKKDVSGYNIPRGRTDSTTWLRQESVSSDVSLSSPLPLQSPISDV